MKESFPLAAKSFERGHPVRYDTEFKCWVYLNDNTIADDSRACILCCRMSTPEGYDPCLGKIPGAVSACCGHGVEPGYILWDKVLLSIHGPNKVSKRQECFSFSQAHSRGNLMLLLHPGYTYFVISRSRGFWDSRHFKTREWENRFYKLAVIS